MAVGVFGILVLELEMVASGLSVGKGMGIGIWCAYERAFGI